MSEPNDELPRIAPISVQAATGKAKELLDELAGRGGEPGPMGRTMATAPALLRGYLDLNRAMKRTHPDRRIVERINLAVHEWLGCEYCLLAHTRAARKLGLSDEEIAEVVGLVALQQLTGSFNLVAGIEPALEDLSELTSRRAA
jgi:AhpD family alkylhydroperoxidase